MKFVDYGYDPQLLSNLHILSRSAPPSRPIHFQPTGPYVLGGVSYHSRPEAACGFLLSKYIPDYRVVPGLSFQVPIGVGSGGDVQTVDFRINDIFVEYHPPRIHQPSRRARVAQRESREIRHLRGLLRKKGVSRRVRDMAYDRLRHCLTSQYVDNRMTLLSASPVIEDFTLIVLTSPEELYRDLLCYLQVPRLPDIMEFISEFKELMKRVTDGRDYSERPQECW